MAYIVWLLNNVKDFESVYSLIGPAGIVRKE